MYNNGVFFPVSDYVVSVRELDAYSYSEKMRLDSHEKHVLTILQCMLDDKAPLWAIQKFLELTN